MTRNEINQVVVSAFQRVIHDHNKSFSGIPNENTAIMGADSPFDSIDLVTFIVAIEQAIEDEYSLTLTLADDRAMSQTNSPFKNINSIVNYIEELIKEQ